MKITDIINFSVKEDHAETADGTSVYFLRLYPPNLNIMTEGEKKAQVNIMKEFYDSLSGLSLQLLSIDKTENLSGNKEYWQSLLKPDDEDDPCREIKTAIIRNIDSIESTSASVGRAFYIVFKTKKQEELTRLETCMSIKDIKHHVVKKQEIVTILRNYILREFVGFDLYDWQKEVEKNYESVGAKKKKVA